MKFKSLALLLSLPAAVTAAENLVFRTDLNVSPVWNQRIINGKELIPLFSAHTWTYGGPTWGKSKAYGPIPHLPVYDDSATIHIGHKRIVNDLKQGGAYAVPAKPSMAGKKIKLQDFFLVTQGKGLMETHKNNTPVFVYIAENRPVFLQNEKYDFDVEDFKAWKKAHPNFMGFCCIDEIDSDAGYYMGGISKMPDSPQKQSMLKRFPVPKNQYEFLDLVDRIFVQETKFHFGENNFKTLSSGSYLGHILAQAGSRIFFYEATGQELARWQVAGAFTRGASRQFDMPFGWYVANWYTGYTRDGKLTQGENRWWGKQGSNGVHMGTGRSLINRQDAYGYLIGSCMIEHENWGWLHIAGSHGKGYPSEIALDYNDLYVFSTKHTRGTPYTPVAILTPISQVYNAVGWSGTSRYAFKDLYNLNAFFYTLMPVLSDDIKHRTLRKRGEQGCLFNSEFGEIYDVICPDSRQDAKTIAKVLSAYKAAFLISEYRKQDLKTDALKEYVKNGGTLFIASNYLEDGFFGEDFSGVKVGDDTVISGKYLVTPEGKIDLKEPYRWVQMTPTKAKVLYKDEKGNAAAYVNKYGKGKVITIACYKMLPEKFQFSRDSGKAMRETIAGKQTYELIKYLLKKVQNETFPVKISGDIQYGLNKTKNGWLLWLINNKGVVKFTYEPEQYQKEKTANVTADVGKLKNKKIYDMWTGKEIPVKNGKISVEVGPGAVKMIAIE